MAQHERHQCSLCIGHHPAYLCPRARCNGGPGKPNWAVYEKKKAKDQGREPDYTQTAPTPAEASPPQPMDTTGPPAHHHAASAEAAPLCAVVAAMHPLPQASPPAQYSQAQPGPMGPGKPMQPLAQSSAQGEVWMTTPMQPIPEEHVPVPGKFFQAACGTCRSARTA